MSIDLTPFCGEDQYRSYLQKPFTLGEFTYATNGHIYIRQPKRDDVPVGDQLPEAKWDRPVNGIEKTKFSPLEVGALPPMPQRTETECEVCDGEGHAHDCPHCTCECGSCDGTGKDTSWPQITTTVRGHTCQLRYVLMALSLPGVVFANKTKDEMPLMFKFDGGVGAVMPTRGPMKEHVEIEAKKAA